MRQILVGFGRGQLQQVDLRKGKPDKGYKGAVGALTDITIVPNERLIISTSLDRILRIHTYEAKELVYKQYLTSKLSNVLVQTETSTPLRHVAEVKEEEVKSETEDIPEDMDQLFDSMETVGERPKKTSTGEPSSLKRKPEDEAIRNLLRITEKTKKKREEKKRQKKAKSVFHNA